MPMRCGVYSSRGAGSVATLVLVAIALGGCEPFPGAIEVSQQFYDFGLSDIPWTFQVWTDNPNVDILTFYVSTEQDWLVITPGSGVSHGPDDKQTITVSVNRALLPPGTHRGTISVSAFGYGTKRIAVSAHVAGQPGERPMQITNLSRNYTAPYLLDFTFSLRDEDGYPILGKPEQFKVRCMENGAAVSHFETGVQLSKAVDKQIKCVLVLDYTASMADPRNGDSDGDGKSDAIEAMEAAAKEVFIEQLRDDALVAIYEFHRDQPPELVCDFSSDKEYLNDCIDSIWDDYVAGYPGTSCAWDAVCAAIEKYTPESQMDESRSILLLSDGRDESSVHRPQKVADRAAEAGVRIYAIGFGVELDVAALRLITSQTQGDFHIADTAADMSPMFHRIVTDIESQYTLRWATLRRGELEFLPAFRISAGEYVATYNSETPYVPIEYTGDTARGMLRAVTSETDDGTNVLLRASYMPRYITEILLYVRSPYDFRVVKVGEEESGLCADWLMTVYEDPQHGGVWVHFQSTAPEDIFTALPYASFGPLVRFRFEQVFAGETTPFEIISIDNSLYRSGQYFEIEGWPAVPPGQPPVFDTE